MGRIQYAAIEGIDGSGKTEVLRRVLSALRAAGNPVYEFSYMGRRGSLLGRFLDRHLFADGGSNIGRILDLLPTLKLVMFQINAAMNWRDLRRRELVGAPDAPIILGDRSVISAGVLFPASWRSWAVTRAVLRLTTRTPTPSHIIYLEIAPEDAHARIRCRSTPLANESVAVLSSASAAYETILATGRWWFAFDVTRIDATRPLDDVVADVQVAAQRAAAEKKRPCA